MLKKLWLSAALAAGIVLAPGTTAAVVAAQLPPLGSGVNDSGVIEVHYRGGGGYRGSYRGGYAARPFIYVGPPAVAYYGYSYRNYDGGHCAWLRRRAHETGSPYWWQRYRNDC